MLDKYKKYHKGEWQCMVPPVCTTYWMQRDWIKWIDSNGTWL